MKRKWILIIVIFILLMGSVFFAGIKYLDYSTNLSLSGISTSITLVEKNFNKLNINLLLPDDLVLFNVSKTYEKYKDFEKHLIVEGGNGMGGFPHVKIYRFLQNDFFEKDFRIQYFINQDEIRIRDQYDINSLTLPDDENHIEKISFTYYTNIVIFQEKDQLILCKDWIGEENENKVLLVSICATEKQWEKLDEVYEEIIYSIEYIE